VSNASSPELAVIESQLKGKTLLVYWYLLRSSRSSVGVREVQRTLGFSSPSVAAHHLDKLLSLGLVDKKGTGEYFLTQEVKVGLLRFFTRLGALPYSPLPVLFHLALHHVDCLPNLLRNRWKHPQHCRHHFRRHSLLHLMV
jgi:predicted DNA-binding transcriptional regulator